ncbi:hypothetical protein [Mesobacillus thioparans]|uniref:hypothetical protein n=1 Tax=Mesobacillus thioparans TaxID=370439 RepID=UPI0039EFA83D
MYRTLSFIVIFSFVSVLLYFHNQNSHYQASDHLESHGHELINVPAGEKTPGINGKVMKDPSGSWLLAIDTENFDFAPEKVGSTKITFNEGHAHIYLNGKKVNRLYGKYYNLGELDKGTYKLKVTLNANNHDSLAIDGNEIAFVHAFEVN